MVKELLKWFHILSFNRMTESNEEREKLKGQSADLIWWNDDKEVTMNEASEAPQADVKSFCGGCGFYHSEDYPDCVYHKDI